MVNSKNKGGRGCTKCVGDRGTKITVKRGKTYSKGRGGGEDDIRRTKEKIKRNTEIE